MSEREIPEPDLPRRVEYDIAEHECLLVFNGDDECGLFHDWWNAKGWASFKKWAEPELKKRQ